MENNAPKHLPGERLRGLEAMVRQCSLGHSGAMMDWQIANKERGSSFQAK